MPQLLTRDATLCDRYPELTIAPLQYLALPLQSKPIDFIDLAAQQDRLRPQLERNIHRVLHHGQYILGPEVAPAPKPNPCKSPPPPSPTC